MIAGFNLKITEDVQSKLQNVSKNVDSSLLRRSLDKYILPNNIADGTRIESDWFPELNADIFISHSHKDENVASALASFFEKDGFKCFIDSQVWGYGDSLLEQINDKYSNKRCDENGGCIYTHSLCNVASQHVNLMLATALQKMLRKTPVIIFLNTPHSIDIYSDVYKNGTYSPWIYYELVTTDTLLRREWEMKKSLQQNFSQENIQDGFNSIYNAPNGWLMDLEFTDFESINSISAFKKLYQTKLGNYGK